MTYVQFGAGLCGPTEWTNFDASPTLRLQRMPVLGRALGRVPPRFPKSVSYGDVVRGLPVAAVSCDVIYSSHVLEHLALDDLNQALRNTLRLLKPGGVFRFVLPDMEYLASEYLKSTDDNAVHEFMRKAHLGVASRKRGLGGLLRNSFGNSSHLWMWDYKAMRSALINAGFVNVRRAYIGDSNDPMLDLVEERGRWENCLGMHCNKPESSGG